MDKEKYWISWEVYVQIIVSHLVLWMEFEIFNMDARINYYGWERVEFAEAPCASNMFMCNVQEWCGTLLRIMCSC